MKTRSLFQVFICILLGWGMISCNLEKKTLPEARGKQGEVVVVINRDLWTGATGDSIRRYLAYHVVGLPYGEPMFSLLQQDALSGFTQQVRNILMITIDPGYESGMLIPKTNAYARNQLVLNVGAPSADSVVACIDRYKDVIVAKFLENDRNSYIDYYSRVVDNKFTEKVQEKFQVDITIPKEYSLDVDKDDFLCFAREERDMSMGILLWKEPYVSKEQLDTEQLIMKMNSMTKKYITGDPPGSYMADEPMVSPVVKRYMKKEVYCVQLNGLWQMENGFMGGPYVNVSIVDEKRGQIVTGMGYVFFPRKEKRDYVRQLEAILYTMVPSVN
ncbi:MAG: DUF4837 family protein [Bacteroidales bacterium]|jgi:hypothetical protein|nr:DUF4837 family protein [Bacteroidales bacterium]